MRRKDAVGDYRIHKVFFEGIYQVEVVEARMHGVA
jgi:hypothetical protein